MAVYYCIIIADVKDSKLYTLFIRSSKFWLSLGCSVLKLLSMIKELWTFKEAPSGLRDGVVGGIFWRDRVIRHIFWRDGVIKILA